MTTWTSRPAGPPSAPARAAAAVSSIQMTASTADANAGLAQAAAGAAQSAADDATTAAGQANSTAMLAAAKFQSLPEANIVINNVDHEAEDWGVTIAASASGATWKAADGGGGVVPPPLTWTQSTPPGARVLLIAMSVAYTDGGGYRTPSISFDDPNLAAGPTAGSDGLSYFTPYGGGSRIVWIVPIGENFTASTIAITATWNSEAKIALADATSLALAGSASGDYDIIQRPSGGYTAPQDSLLIYMATNFGSATTPSVPAVPSGFTSERSVDGLASQQTSKTYQLSSRIASRDIDAAASIALTNSSSTLIIIKSADRPAEDRVGSFAKMVTNSTATAPSNTISNKIMPLNNYYQAETHSPDLAVDLTTASFQIFYTGTYLVDFTVGCDANTGYLPVVLVNGTPESYGGNGAPSGTFPSGLPILSFSTLVYLNKGDYVSFGIWANSGTPALSRAASIPKHAAISLVNRSYL